MALVIIDVVQKGKEYALLLLHRSRVNWYESGQSIGVVAFESGRLTQL